MDNELAEEIEVNLSSNFLVDALIDIVVLIRRFALSFFKMLVELMSIFEK